MAPRREPSTPPDLKDFEYRSLLGSGGFADVFLYEQQRPRREVAVKVLLAEGLTDEGRRQFAAEADLMAALSAHPAIVTIYDADIASDGRPYLVMEYYPGPNLSERVRVERLPVADALRIGIQVSAAIETAHRAGILHRDIKPANILTSRYQKPGLTDFGISASTHGEVSDDQGALSVPWAPPEAFDSADTLDTRADIYSLGATIYTLLAGRTPFELPGQSNTHLDLMTRIERDPVPPIGRQDVPPELERLLAQCMAKQPDNRPQSALSVARALQQIEIDLRFQPTAIDVLDDLPNAARAPQGPEEGDATRIRGVVTIDPQQTAKTVPVFEAPPAPPVGATTKRDDLRAPEVDDRTVRRASPAPSPVETPEVPAAVAPPDDRKGSRGPLLAALAILAVIVVGLGAVIMLNKGSASTATPAPVDSTVLEGEPAPTSILTERPSAPTDITVTQGKGGTATITWTNPDPAPGDSYAWWRADAGASTMPQETTQTSATITGLAKGDVPCVFVVTVRDGVSSTEPGSPTCLAAKG